MVAGGRLSFAFKMPAVKCTAMNFSMQHIYFTGITHNASQRLQEPPLQCVDRRVVASFSPRFLQHLPRR